MDPMIEMLDTRLAGLIADEARIEQIAGGFIFTEGPIWRGDHLLFSDIPNGRIVRWDEEPGGPVVSTFRHPSGNANQLFTLRFSGYFWRIQLDVSTLVSKAQAVVYNSRERKRLRVAKLAASRSSSPPIPTRPSHARA